jgi:hypothetical protein
MAAQVLTVEVSARRELRRQVRCLVVVSPDGERAIVTCRRQVEVVDVVVVVQDVDEAPMKSAPVLARLAPRFGNTSAVNDGVPRYQETVS